MDLSEYLQYGNGTSSSIFIAALTNDTKYIVKYYESDSDLDIRDDREQTLLHLAARNKALKSMELLLKLGMNPNVGDKYKESPLHIAAYMGSVEMVEMLLTHDANPNFRNNTKQTTLHKAAFKGNVAVLKLLLDHKANIYMVDENATSVLQFAVRSKKMKAVRFLIEQGALINTLDVRMDSTLHYAALYSTVEIVKYLMELGVNPYAKNNYKMTPLHLAVEHPHIDMVYTLLDSGLTSYDKSKFNLSPYDIAVQKNRFEAVEYFNKLKNDKDYQMRLKQNPLTLSIVMNEFDKALALIKISDVNQRDIFGNTPLFYAIMNQEAFLVQKLLENDATIYNIDNTNCDAIYYATLVRDPKIVKLIQKRKVDYNKKYGGYTVLEYARHNRNKEVYDLLKKGSQ